MRRPITRAQPPAVNPMTQPLPTVSVALCSYNGAQYIEAQLDSIVRQTVAPDEIIVCDDGSSDATLDLVGEFARRYPTIRLVRNETNLGFTRNFEQAMGLASHDLVFLSDQDDVWLPDRVRIMRDLFAAHPDVGMVYTMRQFTDERLQPIVPTRRFQDERRTVPRTPGEMIRGWGAIPGCAIAFRSTLKPFLLPIPDAWGHDAWITIMAYALSNVRRTGEVLMYYRIHSGSGGGNVKCTAPLSQAFASKIKRSQAAYYTQERVRWAGFYERLLWVASSSLASSDRQAAANRFLEEARRRAEFARRRESLKLGPRAQRILPALRLLAAGGYGRYMNGLLTFAKDVVLS